MLCGCASSTGVQIVHDIEYGYGDPLRCKVGAARSISMHCMHLGAPRAWVPEDTVFYSGCISSCDSASIVGPEAQLHLGAQWSWKLSDPFLRQLTGCPHCNAVDHSLPHGIFAAAHTQVNPQQGWCKPALELSKLLAARLAACLDCWVFTGGARVQLQAPGRDVRGQQPRHCAHPGCHGGLLQETTWAPGQGGPQRSAAIHGRCVGTW